MKKEKLVYVEPADYFPEDIRKKHGLGEYADSNPHQDDDNELAITIMNQAEQPSYTGQLTTPLPALEPEDE